MKATGIVRRIDDLGRVVIPKEIRRTLRLREGTPLEIFTDREGEIILKKYSPMVELNNKNSSDGNHVGVANVRKRLELYYGEEHEMYFESREGEGTSVHLFICAEGGRRAE